jgi:predicted enzyme related to lactoylglutathione lyase
MPERDGYIAGVPCWVDTSQPDPEAAVDFYRDLFGWEFENVMPPDSPAKYYIGRIRGGDVAAVGSQSEGAPPAAVWNTYVLVDRADETAAKVIAAGGRVLMEPFDIMEEGRMATFADPEGAVFSVWQPRKFKGAQIVNEHGSLNFNGLATRDPEAAKAFYASVFGWEALDLGAAGLLWVLPGYADFLELSDPGLRERVASLGGPDGFADVVAAINPIADDDPETPSYWGVTFASDDAAAVAAKAKELGGAVIVPPFDAPWVKLTVIADPQGATFTVGQFVPENDPVANSTLSAA